MRLAIAIILLCAGCSDWPSDEEVWQSNCASYGFHPGTDAFANCVQQQALAKDENFARMIHGYK